MNRLARYAVAGLVAAASLWVGGPTTTAQSSGQSAGQASPIGEITKPVAVGHVYQPTDAVVLPDGRLLVLEKQGVIKLFPTIVDQVPIRVLEMTQEVWSYKDFGAMALALSPTFETDQTLYMLYNRDALPRPQATSPEWGSPAVPDDICINDIDPGCVIGARLISMQLTPDNRIENVKTVLESGPTSGWCFQFDGHGIGDLLFDTEGALLVSSGDGARSDPGDTGLKELTTGCGAHFGDEKELEGGSLRALDALTPSLYTSFNGTIIRIDPTTGDAWPTNVLVGGEQSSDDRIVAIGFRNPFRMALDTQGNTVFVGEVGANRAEEVNAIDTTKFGSTVQNFQWPCLEGQQPSLFEDIASSPLCGATQAIPNSIGVAALTYATLPAKWCGEMNIAVIGGDVFTRGDGSRWYVFDDWVGGCMLALPIAADRTLDVTKAVLIDQAISPARIRNVEGNVMIVDVTRNVVRISPEPFLDPTPPSDGRLGRWMGRVILALIVCGLLAVLLIRRRVKSNAQGRADRLKVGGVSADVTGDDSLSGTDQSNDPAESRIAD